MHEQTPRRMTRLSASRRARHVGERVQIQGWLYNLRKSGKIVFPDYSRWQRHDAVRCGEEQLSRRVFETLKGSDAGKLACT